MRRDHGEDLFRLIYASRAVLPELPRFEALVANILKSAQPNNARNGVTGLLVAHQGWFVQVLEGPRRKVSNTFGVIGRDLRHVQLEMISAGSADRRLFGDWSMCARNLNAAAAPALKALELENDFDPFSLSPEKALQLLQVLARIGPAELKLAC